MHLIPNYAYEDQNLHDDINMSGCVASTRKKTTMNWSENCSELIGGHGKWEGWLMTHNAY